MGCWFEGCLEFGELAVVRDVVAVGSEAFDEALGGEFCVELGAEDRQVFHAERLVGAGVGSGEFDSVRRQAIDAVFVAHEDRVSIGQASEDGICAGCFGLADEDCADFFVFIVVDA